MHTQAIGHTQIGALMVFVGLYYQFVAPKMIARYKQREAEANKTPTQFPKTWRWFGWAFIALGIFEIICG